LVLKWPNDVFWQGRKLVGVLLEMAGGADGGGYVVAGIGVNVCMPESEGQRIDQPWTDLATVLQGEIPSRNVLAARLLNVVVPVIYSFERGGDINLQQAWRRYDFTYGQVVELQTESGRKQGKALGIDAEGRLLLEINGRPQAFACGEVSFLSVPRR
jgi:BirA family transcriptional regulator, biotin operon repressor / biotin---[acetyl-CoA-carboxylase] ligase